jgi:Protein of unknown function (DUF3037)
MAEWEYRLIRYCPDPVRGERLNIGITLFDGARYHFRFLEPITRVHYLDPKLDPSLLADLRQDLESHTGDLSYIRERIGAFDPTFAFSDGRVTLNGQPPQDVIDRLYQRLVYLPAPRRPMEAQIHRVPHRRAKLLREFLERMEVPRVKIFSGVRPTDETQQDLFGLRARPEADVPAVTACVPNGTSVIVAEPLLIPRLTPSLVFALGSKFRTYQERVQPMARKTILRATIFFDANDNGEKGRSLFPLSRDISKAFSEKVCDSTNADSVADFQQWLWQVLHDAPLLNART